MSTTPESLRIIPLSQLPNARDECVPVVITSCRPVVGKGTYTRENPKNCNFVCAFHHTRWCSSSSSKGISQNSSRIRQFCGRFGSVRTCVNSLDDVPLYYVEISRTRDYGGLARFVGSVKSCCVLLGMLEHFEGGSLRWLRGWCSTNWIGLNWLFLWRGYRLQGCLVWGRGIDFPV